MLLVDSVEHREFLCELLEAMYEELPAPKKRRVGFGKKIVLGDKSEENCNAIAKVMTDAGFDVEPFVMDLSDLHQYQRYA